MIYDMRMSCVMNFSWHWNITLYEVLLYVTLGGNDDIGAGTRHAKGCREGK